MALIIANEARRIAVTLLPKYQSHCCRNIIRNGDKLLLRNQATKIAISLRGSDRGGHARLYYDRGDYCPDGDSESFYEGCIAYVRGMADQADNGVGVGTLTNPDAVDDDDNK
jgi:hypothetical protein